jgi:hypothetical protein
MQNGDQRVAHQALRKRQLCQYCPPCDVNVQH